jgi:hypothetical protein
MSVTLQITGGLVLLSDNPIQVVLTCTVPHPNQRLALKITCPELIGSPFIEEIAPQNNHSVFDISGFFSQPIEPEFHFPVTGVVSGHSSLVFNASLDVGEIYTDDAGDRIVTWENSSSGNQIRVIKGKLRPHELGILNDQGKSFASEYINGGKFLTNIADDSVVGPAQIVKLWYLSRWTDDHQAVLKTRVFTSLKSAYLPISQELVLYSITGLVELSLNPVFQGFQPDPGELIEGFEVWLEDANGEISQRLRLVVDNNFYEQEFLLLYQNNFKAIESFRLTGQYSENLSTESEPAVRALPALTGSKTAGMILLSSSGKRSWTINTGYKSMKEMKMIRDVLESRYTWLIDPDNANQLLPVVIDSGEFELFTSEADIPNLSLTIREAYL